MMGMLLKMSDASTGRRITMNNHHRGSIHPDFQKMTGRGSTSKTWLAREEKNSFFFIQDE
jgi:hypothetical protein